MILPVPAWETEVVAVQPTGYGLVFATVRVGDREFVGGGHGFDNAFRNARIKAALVLRAADGRSAFDEQ